jgi:ribosomal protein L7/L12
MKLGQHLSYFDAAVPDDVRAALAALQTQSAPLAVSQIQKILRSELGDASPILGSLELTPLASASIGQVHRARLSDGTRVAVKVQYPGIATAITADFGPASLAAGLAAWRYPSSQARSLLREAKACALAECDYRSEARQQADLAVRYADHPVIVIPAVHEAYCTARVLVTTYADGSQLGAWLATGPDHAQREAIGEALVAFYVGTALRWGVLPGDPHPGNYLVMPGGRLAIVDHGCIRSCAPSRARLVLEADDEATAHRAAAELGADALLLLRVRLGVAAVLAQLGVRTGWRALVDQAMAQHAAAAATGSWGAPPAEPSTTRFDVVLVAPGERTIEIMREVRDLMGANIRDAKQLLEQTPCVLRTTTDRREAEAVKHRLETSGGTVEIQAS